MEDHSLIELEENEVTQWAANYRKECATTLFFDGYGKLPQTRKDDPALNFFAGSDLLGMKEVPWCKVLRWLLDHSLGAQGAASFQAGLHKLVGLEVAKPYIVVEKEVFDGKDKRLDILMGEGPSAILIEAKVNAPRDDAQLVNYAKGKSYKAMLFLTKFEQEKLPKPWKSITWKQIAVILENILRDGPGHCPRVDERWASIAEDFSSYIGNRTQK